MAQQDFYFFWGGPFSQWSSAPMTIKGEYYGCCEQYMMAQKALLFRDTDTHIKIMATQDPSEQKKLGRLVRGFNKTNWEAVAQSVVYEANYAKFTQNPSLAQLLAATAGKTIVEASPQDRVWGIGLAASDPRAQDPTQWLGTNWLGQAIMKVRQAMRQQGLI